MKKVFLGPPGSGKGTYSKRIAPQKKIPHISTGDLLREHLKKNTEIGKRAKEYMDKGLLVPDEVVIETLKERLAFEDCKEGFILDGFPRTINQAKMLQEITEIDAVINLEIPEDILIEKICARRVCKNCGDIYNIADINREGIRMPPMNPRKEGSCDKCGSEIVQRSDDTEEIVKQRLVVYHEQTKPLIDFYFEKRLLRHVRIKGPPEEMVLEILSILKKIEETNKKL